NRADAHAAQLGKAFADTALDDIFELNNPEQFGVLGDSKWRATRLGDSVGHCRYLAHSFGAYVWAQHLHSTSRAHSVGAAVDIVQDCIDGALPDRSATHLNAAHPRLRCEWNEVCFHFHKLASANAVLFLCQHDNGTSFRCFVSERREMCRVR